LRNGHLVLNVEHLHPHNPSLIFTRVSGYGQTGPLAARPGYGSVCEAESGFRYINGCPDAETGGLFGPQVRPNISLGDCVAGLHAAFGAVLALLARERQGKDKRSGTTVDVSIGESVVNLVEGIIPEYDRKGKAHRVLPLLGSFLRTPTLVSQNLLRLQLQHTSSSAPTATASTTA